MIKTSNEEGTLVYGCNEGRPLIALGEDKSTCCLNY